MDANAALYLELLERRAELLNLLALELREAQPSIVGIDVAEIDRQSMRQESLCAELRFTWGELASLRSVQAESLASDQKNRWNAAIAANEKAAADLTRVQSVQAALLRRSRRSINVLMNVLSSSSVGYVPPWTSTQVHSFAVGA